MLVDILLIALVGMFAGLFSIPFGFSRTDSFWVVYLGNALGSLFAVLMLLYVSQKYISRFFDKRIDPEKFADVSRFINKYGVRLFGLICPLFPGTTVSVPSAIALKLDMKKFARWLYAGIFLVSAGYVYGYYALFIK